MDEKEVNLFLDQVMIVLFKNDLLGNGKWSSEATEEMKVKYLLSHKKAPDGSSLSQRNKAQLCFDDSAWLGFGSEDEIRSMKA